MGKLQKVTFQGITGISRLLLGILCFTSFGTSAHAAKSVFEFTGGSVEATHLGRSGFTTSSISQQYAGSVSYNQDGQIYGSFDVATLTPASGSAAEANPALGWLLASTFEGGAGSFPVGGLASETSTGYRFTITPDSGYTLDFSNAKFVLDLGASKRSNPGASGTFRVGIFYQINNGPIVPYSDGRDFDVTVDNAAPNISVLDSVNDGASLLDPNNSASLNRTLDNDYRMLTGLSADLSESITGLSQGDTVTFYLLGVTNRNGTAYNMLVDNLGVVGLTSTNPSVPTEELVWNPSLDNFWSSLQTGTVTITLPDGTVEVHPFSLSNWDDSTSGLRPDEDTAVHFLDSNEDRTVLLADNRSVAGAAIDSQNRYSLDQLDRRYLNTLSLDGDLSVRNSAAPNAANSHNAYCNIEPLSNSTWDIAENQAFSLWGELQGCSTIVKAGAGELWLYGENPPAFRGGIDFQEGQIITDVSRISNSVISFTEAPNANANRILFLGGMNPSLAGMTGPADGTVSLTEPGQSLSLGSEGIPNDEGYATLTLTKVIGPEPSLDLGTGTFHCNISGSESDLLVVPGTLDISGATLQIHPDNIASFSSTTVATYGSLTGEFAQIHPAGYEVRAENGQLIVVAPDLPPVITLNGDSVINLVYGDTYVEQGATIADNDSNLPLVTGGDTVDTLNPGTYLVTYDATDSAGNHAVQQIRTVTVNPPVGQTLTWTGTSSSDWVDGSNWSAGRRPFPDDDVVIPNVTPYPEISNGVSSSIKSLILQGSSELTIAFGGRLGIEGASGDGALIAGTLRNYGTLTVDNTFGHGVRVRSSRGDLLSWGDVFIGQNGMIGGSGLEFENVGQMIISDRNGFDPTPTLLIDNTASHAINLIKSEVKFDDRYTAGVDIVVRIGSQGPGSIGGTGFFVGSGSLVSCAEMEVSIDNVQRGIEIRDNADFNTSRSSVKIGTASNFISGYGINIRDRYAHVFSELVISNTLLAAINNLGQFYSYESTTVIDGLVNDVTSLNDVVAPGPSIGKYSANGDFSFTNATLEIEVNGITQASDHDLFEASGIVTLGGVLSPIINYNPSLGDRIVFLTAASFVGTFSSFDPMPVGWVLDYSVPGEVALVYQALGMTTPSVVSVEENQTAVVDVEAVDDSDSEGNGLTYSFTTLDGGGAENGLFSLNTVSGIVTFNTAPDFETPNDSDMDNNYEIQITVGDSSGDTWTQNFTVTVTDVFEIMVAFESWIDQYYPGETDPAIIGPNADPSGNGVTNWFSFITDIDPTSNTGKVLDVTYNPASIVISYTIRDDVGDAAPQIQLSSNLSEFDDVNTFLTNNNIHSGFGVSGFPLLRTTVDGVNVSRITYTIPTGNLPTVFHRFAAGQ